MTTLKKTLKFFIFQDWSANHGNYKFQIILVAFRIAHSFKNLRKPWIFIAYPYLILYRVIIEWVLCVELPWKLHAGPGLKIFHGQSLVINDKVIIGNNCTLRHCTTIGVAKTDSKFSGEAPVIGNNVDIGANTVILGAIKIGNDAIIGAGSVVVHDVPDKAIVVGNPAKVLRYLP